MGLMHHQWTVPRPHPPLYVAHSMAPTSTHCPLWRGCHSTTRLRPLRAGDEDRPTTADIQNMDSNQLQTALNVAIASEDYVLAAQLRNALSSLLGEQPSPSDWRHLGILDWIATRAERLGFRYPTGTLALLLCTTPQHVAVLEQWVYTTSVLLQLSILQVAPPPSPQPSKSARSL